MSFFGFFSSGKMSRKQKEENILQDVPIFPLKAVLFPGGRLPLQVFESRYIKMSADCQARQEAFGLCLLQPGSETSPVPHTTGTLAHIEQQDTSAPDVLRLVVRGGRRFQILDSSTDNTGVLRARVQLMAEPVARPLPPSQAGLLPLLRKIVADMGEERIPLPHLWNNAAWVGYRLSESMPVQLLARQKLLELDDPASRLEILQQYLQQRGLGS